MKIYFTRFFESSDYAETRRHRRLRLDINPTIYVILSYENVYQPITTNNAIHSKYATSAKILSSDLLVVKRLLTTQNAFKRESVAGIKAEHSK